MQQQPPPEREKILRWVKATSKEAEEIFIQVGDAIRIYGKETIVEGFHGAYNEGLGKWETIIMTTKRGDPFERSMDVIEVDANKPYRPTYVSEAPAASPVMEEKPEEFSEWLYGGSHEFVYNNTFCKTGRTMTETERLNYVAGAKAAYRHLMQKSPAPVIEPGEQKSDDRKELIDNAILYNRLYVQKVNELASARQLILDIKRGNIYQEPADECDKWLTNNPEIK